MMPSTGGLIVFLPFLITQLIEHEFQRCTKSSLIFFGEAVGHSAVSHISAFVEEGEEIFLSNFPL